MALRSTQRWRPPATGKPELDQALRTAYDTAYGLEQQAVLGSEKGMVVAVGESRVTGSLKDIATGLESVLGFVGMLKTTSAVNEWVTGAPSTGGGGRIDLAIWKPTGVADTTPIASTTARDGMWTAWGFEE